MMLEEQQGAVVETTRYEQVPHGQPQRLVAHNRPRDLTTRKSTRKFALFIAFTMSLSVVKYSK